MSKKGKKSFSQGLGDLFSQLDEQPKGFEPEVETIVRPRTRKKEDSESKKSFADDLSLFFQEAINESVEEKAQQINSGKPKKSTKRRTKPVFGIDSLIRQTLQEGAVSTGRKRISFTFDTDKIEKLKAIAALEKARIRDIVDELITSYINDRDTEG
ncbi:MAG: hypothetical protein AAF598_20580 [Bacteroidota bacterium]